MVDRRDTVSIRAGGARSTTLQREGSGAAEHARRRTPGRPAPPRSSELSSRSRHRSAMSRASCRPARRRTGCRRGSTPGSAQTSRPMTRSRSPTADHRRPRRCRPHPTQENPESWACTCTVCPSRLPADRQTVKGAPPRFFTLSTHRPRIRRGTPCDSPLPPDLARVRRLRRHRHRPDSTPTATARSWSTGTSCRSCPSTPATRTGCSDPRPIRVRSTA